MTMCVDVCACVCVCFGHCGGMVYGHGHSILRLFRISIAVVVVVPIIARRKKTRTLKTQQTFRTNRVVPQWLVLCRIQYLLRLPLLCRLPEPQAPILRQPMIRHRPWVQGPNRPPRRNHRQRERVKAAPQSRPTPVRGQSGNVTAKVTPVSKTRESLTTCS